MRKRGKEFRREWGRRRSTVHQTVPLSPPCTKQRYNSKDGRALEEEERGTKDGKDRREEKRVDEKIRE